MKFLNSAFGSWIKIVIVAILTMMINKGNIFEITLHEYFNAAIFSILPIIINYLNPHDTRYGKK